MINVGVEKKQFRIFLFVAYGMTYLMGVLMWYGYAKGVDLSAFPSAQMLYPAAGVALAYLLTQREDSKVPKGFYRIFLGLTVISVWIAIASVFVPQSASSTGMSLWNLAEQFFLIAGSIVGWIALGIAGKEKREAYGLRWKKGKTSIFCIVLFLVLYFLRTVLSCGISGQLGEFLNNMTRPITWINIVALPINFFLVFVAFFGEEYGWRYYMQPYLQRKYGRRGGVLLLGVVWGLWHLPVDFFYYTTPDMGILAALSQQITCITLGIFFAYAYMKTNNIWVPVILHYLNNNLIPVISANYSAEVLQNQQIRWVDLPISLVVNGIFFGIFLFFGPLKKKSIEK